MVVFLISINESADLDLFARLAVGRLIDSLGYVPLVDPFSWTANKELFIDHEWLSGVIFWKALSTFGASIFIPLSMVMAAATIIVIIRAQFKWSNQICGSLLITALGVLGASHLWTSVVRCQVFTYLLFALLLSGVVDLLKRRSATLLVATCLAFPIWGNLHGGVAVGIGILGLTSLGLFIDRRFQDGIVVGMCGLVGALSVVFFNPYPGFIYAEFLLDALTLSRPWITEWQWSNPLNIENLPVYLIVALIVQGLVLSKKGPGWTPLVLMLGTLYEAVSHVRLQPLFIFVALVFFSEEMLISLTYFRAKLAPLSHRFERAWGIVALGIALFGLGFTTKRVIIDGPPSVTHFPLQAVEYLWSNGDGGNLLVDFNTGSFAIWRLYPRYRVSLDGRYEEVYSDETSLAVSQALNPDNPRGANILKDLNPDYVLLVWNRAENNLAAFRALGYSVIYNQEDGVVLSKSTPERPDTKLDQDTIWQPRW